MLSISMDNDNKPTDPEPFAVYYFGDLPEERLHELFAAWPSSGAKAEVTEPRETAKAPAR